MMKFRFNKIGAAFLSCLLIVSCNPKYKDRLKKADLVAEHHNFKRKLVKGGDFWLTTYERITDKNAPYAFYIEGDGFAYYRKGITSEDPTPINPLMLKLATLDSRPNIVYIARPCQYTNPELNPKCRESYSYWTLQKMSENVVDSVNKVINAVNNDKPFSLIGYSGGGGMAVIIAARNKLTKDVITVAGNLHIKKFVQEHNAYPLLGSLDPMNYARDIKHIPQLHLSGGKDNVVKPFIADEYVQASNSICVHQQVLEDNSHNVGWENSWKYILSQKLGCYKN